MKAGRRRLGTAERWTEEEEIPSLQVQLSHGDDDVQLSHGDDENHEHGAVLLFRALFVVFFH